MNRDETLAWLAALQADVGATLRTPLDPSEGTLRATPQRYPSALISRVRVQPGLSNHERLAVYNRQYWFRLLRVLQNDLPLFTALLGPWFFNQVAMKFLHAQAPREYDVGRVTDGFEAFAQAELDGMLRALTPRPPAIPRDALIEACRIDLAYRSVFFAPEQAPYSPPRDERALLRSSLRFSAAFASFEEHWPLLELRGWVIARDDDRALELPARLAAPQHWALARTSRGVAQVRLASRQARLLALLQQHPVEAALAQLEAECPAHERAALPAAIQGWLARAVEHRFFTAND